jgi:hypothetical protein
VSRALVALALVMAFTACSPQVPRITAPASVDAFCAEQRRPLMTAIESIVSTTQDAPDAGPVPAGAALRAELRGSGGVIAHWPGQRLLLPKTAANLGSTDGYVTLHAAAITNELSPDGSWRRVYLQLDDHGTTVWKPFRAFDVQNVCVDGQRLS